VEREDPEDLGVNGKIMLRVDLREIELEDVDWMHLVQDRDQWRTVVNTIMNLRIL
jgi:hypothetical protein